ncbi:bacteriophage protein [Caballeronia fortuita]|uniref:Bacteriophage protein n=2 Tax=Caballeronia fortuita TaxID=1777138 RepID=A0A157Z9N2_9BURK|nr:type II toxin-antitoxin system RelE/ParE family toxin [Caballeronia fortuita]SAK42235.1 bacteriophage protein [Caballeronia fortuita]
MLTSENQKWTITYYDEHLIADIRKLPAGIRAGFWRMLEKLQEHGADLRMPYSRPMGEGLFELRPRGEEGIGRAFYCTMIHKRIVILHVFVKKTQETPGRELRVARARMKRVKA